MSNDKDFDRLFQKAFEDWSFEPSEEGMQKMASQLNALENSRLDGLFTSKFSAWKQTVTAGALSRMKWLLFWRKNRALITGAAVVLLLATGGWWYTEGENASTRKTQTPKTTLPTQTTPESSPATSDVKSADPAISKGEGSPSAGLNESANAMAKSGKSAQQTLPAEQTAQPGETIISSREVTPTVSSVSRESVKPINSENRADGETMLTPEKQEELASSGAENRPENEAEGANHTGDAMEHPAALVAEKDETSATADAPSAISEKEEEENSEEGAVVSTIPAAPWRSFKPLNWYYSVSAGVDLGINTSALAPTPHVGFRVTRLLNPLITLQTGVNYLQRAQINESIHHTDTVYSFGIELHEREAKPIRMHFVEVPLVVGWQFAPGQFIHVGASASYAFMHEVHETVDRWVAENAAIVGAESTSARTMRGNLSGLANWDLHVKLGYGIKFNQRWGARVGGTFGLRDMTDGSVFSSSAHEMNRNIWLQGSLQYQLNHIK